MSTVMLPIPLREVSVISITVDEAAAYVETGFGARLTANLLREIADELDPPSPISGPADD